MSLLRDSAKYQGTCPCLLEEGCSFQYHLAISLPLQEGDTWSQPLTVQQKVTKERSEVLHPPLLTQPSPRPANVHEILLLALGLLREAFIVETLMLSQDKKSALGP